MDVNNIVAPPAQNGLTPMEAGKLLADVEHIRETQEKQQEMMERILNKLDDRVTRDEFERYKKDHKEEIGEQYVHRSEVAGLIKLWGFVTSTFGKWVAAALAGALVALTYQTISSTVLIKEFKQNQVIQKEERHGKDQ